ncbi:MAG: GIN domain-containing protein [Telluria sp.]
MNKMMTWGAGAALMLAMGVAVADDTVTETRPVDARVARVHVEGVVNLTLKQGDTPSLTLTGDRKYVSRTTAMQSGETLNIDTDINQHGHIDGKSIKAVLVLPRLREVVSESVGSTEVHGFSGDELVVGLEGAGAVKVNCNYRMVYANLGGVGAMNIAGMTGEGLNLDLRGAGYVTLTGKAKWLKANLGGLGGLDAEKFDADSVNVDLSGLGNATVWARQNASLNLSGLGSVTVLGKPLNRKVSVDGLGKVSWK